MQTENKTDQQKNTKEFIIYDFVILCGQNEGSWVENLKIGLLSMKNSLSVFSISNDDTVSVDSAIQRSANILLFLTHESLSHEQVKKGIACGFKYEKNFILVCTFHCITLQVNNFNVFSKAVENAEKQIRSLASSEQKLFQKLLTKKVHLWIEG